MTCFKIFPNEYATRNVTEFNLCNAFISSKLLFTFMKITVHGDLNRTIGMRVFYIMRHSEQERRTLVTIHEYFTKEIKINTSDKTMKQILFS